ncbi:uncharacterized protein LOC141850212 [Brevipalpus obovatus]|uniref:uncharacterized protein LOC141850212 n=1 Tax=Brevipalpus obovatus TaxID=246614 RepID=UPI003D9FA37B
MNTTKLGKLQIKLSKFFTDNSRKGYQFLPTLPKTNFPGGKGYLGICFDDNADKTDSDQNLLIKCLTKSSNSELEVKLCRFCPRYNKRRSGPYLFQNQKALVSHYLDFHQEKLRKFLWYVVKDQPDQEMKASAAEILVLWKESEEERTEKNLINRISKEDLEMLKGLMRTEIPTPSETITISMEPQAEPVTCNPDMDCEFDDGEDVDDVDDGDDGDDCDANDFDNFDDGQQFSQVRYGLDFPYEMEHEMQGNRYSNIRRGYNSNSDRPGHIRIPRPSDHGARERNNCRPAPEDQQRPGRRNQAYDHFPSMERSVNPPRSQRNERPPRQNHTSSGYHRQSQGKIYRPQPYNR